jgi:hypothetical protein
MRPGGTEAGAVTNDGARAFDGGRLLGASAAGPVSGIAVATGGSVAGGCAGTND